MAEKTMIERVARTLCRLDGHPEDTRFEGKPMWRSYADEARAVLFEMREPTDLMDTAACDRDKLGWDPAPTTVWQTMIDAALAEPVRTA